MLSIKNSILYYLYVNIYYKLLLEIHIKTVKTTKRDSGKYNQKIGVFVSRLDPTTKSLDVAMYLKHVYGKLFNVDQLRNKFPGYT